MGVMTVKTINLDKLREEIVAVAPCVRAVSGDGSFVLGPDATPEQAAAAAKAVASHDPAPTPAQARRERLAALNLDPCAAAVILFALGIAPEDAQKIAAERADAILKAWTGA